MSKTNGLRSRKSSRFKWYTVTRFAYDTILPPTGIHLRKASVWRAWRAGSECLSTPPICQTRDFNDRVSDFCCEGCLAQGCYAWGMYQVRRSAHRVRPKARTDRTGFGLMLVPQQEISAVLKCVAVSADST